MDEKQKKQSEKIIKQLIKENKIIKPDPKIKEFFLKKASTALQISKRINEISQQEDIDAYMWTINTSYYCLFYAATALLAHFKQRIKTDVGIHKLTYHALVYYFILEDNKLQKHFIEEYKESYEEAEQLLQISEEKAIELIENFKFEHKKRIIFTYEVGKEAEMNKAQTSIKRAENFLIEARKIIEK